MTTEKRVIRIFHLRSSGGLYGAEAVIMNVARELNRMGCVNHICCINNLKNPHAELLDEACRIGIVASAADSVALLDWGAVEEIRAALSQGDFHILHCHDYKASLYGLLASRGMKIRRVVTNHLWDSVDWKLWLYQRIEGVSYNWFDTVVAVSEAVKRDIRPFILHRSKITVITNGVNTAEFGGEGPSAGPLAFRNDVRLRFGLGSGDLVIGIVGRLARQKGHEYLLKAMALLSEQIQGHGDTRIQDERFTFSGRLCLLIVGGGPLEKKLKSLCRELGLAFTDLQENTHPDPATCGPVIFAGVQTDMHAVYQAMDFFVMPSLEEGLPMALLEAAASGVPVAATPVGQIPRIIRDGETGFLVKPRDEQELARTLKRMITLKGWPADGINGNGLNAIIRRARTLVQEEYSSRAMAKKYLEVYAWLAE